MRPSFGSLVKKIYFKTIYTTPERTYYAWHKVIGRKRYKTLFKKNKELYMAVESIKWVRFIKIYPKKYYNLTYKSDEYRDYIVIEQQTDNFEDVIKDIFFDNLDV